MGSRALDGAHHHDAQTFIILGIFLDDTAMLVIVAPLYIPLVRELGFDLVWFGVLYTITCQIAYITPPFGYNLFLMRSLAPKEITLVDIYRSIWPFVIMMVGCILLVVIFPRPCPVVAQAMSMASKVFWRTTTTQARK